MSIYFVYTLLSVNTVLFLNNSVKYKYSFNVKNSLTKSLNISKEQNSKT